MSLVAEGVSVRYGGLSAIDGVSFALEPGAIVGLIGPNGAGKTTLVNVLSGFQKPSAGEVRLDERRFVGAAPDAFARAGVARTFQAVRLFKRLSVSENLRFWRDFLGGMTSDPAENLAIVELDHAARLPAAYLSAGQRRRLSIARLLTVRRPVWLLDEPTNALDTAGQKLFSTLMGDHLARGGLIIAATHMPLGIAARTLRVGDAS